MEASSTSLPPVSSPPLKGIKKVFSTSSSSLRGRNNDDVSSLRGGFRGSTDSTAEKSPSRASQDSSRDGNASSQSGSSGIKKLIPGHAKRKRQRQRQEAFGELEKERLNGNTLLPIPDPNQSSTNLSQDGDSSLLTDDEEPEVAPPPLLSHDSHTGYLTTSSPLITTTTVDGVSSPTQIVEPGLFQVPSKGSENPNTADISPKTSPPLPTLDSTTSLPSIGLIDKADTLRLPGTSTSERRKSITSSIRGISPARRLKEKFTPTRPDKSPRTSPDRASRELFSGDADVSLSKAATIPERRQAKNPDKPPLVPTNINIEPEGKPKASNTNLPSIDTTKRPQTPPSAKLTTPLTTVTPPTPTESERFPLQDIDHSTTEATSQPVKDGSRVVVSPSGNMISHRRARSQNSISHQPSRLSNSIFPPLTPTIEETKTPSIKNSDSRNVTPGGGFFSSFVSAAQNAATTFTNTLNNTQNRSRSSTSGSEPEKAQPSEVKTDDNTSETEPETPKKRLAIETLGMGDLSFSHLGLDVTGTNGENPPPSLRPDLEELRKNSSVRRDEAAAKIEDMLAKRAVSAAYEKNGTQTPVAEVPDPMNAVKHQSTMSSIMGGDFNESGSIFESEAGSVKRNNSVRSRIQKRRSRGSSGATGTSAIGAMIGASTATLANPASGPRLTGFAVAPKQRNRAFHQLFRSVPDDDYLIEDYSCALQRDILLAGRIYISEGHICFSSNILGWVTTLVISFEEVVSFEKESTAVVFPNAIAIQTLHARHTFRSLLSREATFDLLIGIWKASHPAAFQKSINGRQMEQEAQQTAEKNVESEAESEPGSEDEDEVYDEDEDGEGAGSILEANGSIAGSDTADLKSVVRKPSGINGNLGPPTATVTGTSLPGEKSATAAAEAATDFPGPASHAPTECSDSATHYDIVIKDEIIPAPLGKIYSMLYGPASGVFVMKYLNEECKVMDLEFEDDGKGISNENKSRQYTYIKPLGGSIGPKQTKCITTETIDAFDLEKAVSVTCTTQTPDVPSGNAFSVKTRYCLSWAPNNSTRFQMNCGIEWTAKSWLKGPIEKGAKDGQQTYGNDIVKALNAAVTRRRATTVGSKSAKVGKKRRKGEKSTVAVTTTTTPQKEEDWGIFELFRGPLGPVVRIFRPLANGNVAVCIIVCLLLFIWFRGPSRQSAGVGYPAYSGSDRIAAYEELWRREESELWDWLEERVGIDGLVPKDGLESRNTKTTEKDAKLKRKQRQRILGGKDAGARLQEERMSEREIQAALRLTEERLHTLRDVVERRRSSRQGDKDSEQ